MATARRRNARWDPPPPVIARNRTVSPGARCAMHGRSAEHTTAITGYPPTVGPSAISTQSAARPRGSAPRPGTLGPTGAPHPPMLDCGSQQAVPIRSLAGSIPNVVSTRTRHASALNNSACGPGTTPHWPWPYRGSLPWRREPHRHHSLARFSHDQPIARPQEPPLHSPKPSREIRPPAPQHRRDVDTARHCDIQKPPAHEPTHHQLAPGVCAIAPVHCHRLAIQCRLDPRPRQRKRAGAIPLEVPPAQAPFQCRGAGVVPHERVPDGMRPAIHRPATGHAVRAMPRPARILHGQVRRRADDLNHSPPARTARGPPPRRPPADLASDRTVPPCVPNGMPSAGNRVPIHSGLRSAIATDPADRARLRPARHH